MAAPEHRVREAANRASAVVRISNQSNKLILEEIRKREKYEKTQDLFLRTVIRRVVQLRQCSTDSNQSHR